MKTPLPDAKLSQAGDHRGTGRKVSAQPTGPDAVLVGKVLRMWRPRPGRPTPPPTWAPSPGSDVFAPVTGTVVKVKKYKLYGKWDDYELHIQPDGYPELDIVMIHVKDVSCAAGRPGAGGRDAHRGRAQGLGQVLRAALELHEGRRQPRAPAGQRRDRPHVQGARRRDHARAPRPQPAATRVGYSRPDVR